ncbi:MAG: F0F1 ATP synthase subunit delta [Mariprofundaceae bacterium]|nr:F0F1 ATP synthase subunit delta [Mariprofundaceae bacterium]
MAENITIARPYARALFTEACTSKTFDDWQEALDALSVIVDCLMSQHVIGNPKVSDAHLTALCFDTLVQSINVKKDFEQELQRFVDLLILEKRLMVVPQMAALFRQLVMERNNIIAVDVTSASTLTDTQKQHLMTSLEHRFKSQVTVDYFDDPSLIGGLIIKSDNWVFDGSIRSKLMRLAERII